MPYQAPRPPVATFGLPPAGEAYVRELRRNASQRVNATRGVAKVRFPSKKVGEVIQCASRTAEFPVATGFEWDDDVTEYWDQPPPIKLNYRSKTGRNTGVLSRPDYGVHRRSSGWGLVEVKHLADIDSLIAQFPERYVASGPGNWRCPPGEISAEKLGMSFELLVPTATDEIYHRNYNWLEDYFLEDLPPDHDRCLSEMRSLVEDACGRIRLSELVQRFADPSPVYRAIALRQLFFDTQRDLICRPANSWVYRDEATAVAWTHIDGVAPLFHVDCEFRENSRYEFSGVVWTICQIDGDVLLLESETGARKQRTRQELTALLEQGLATQAPQGETHSLATEILQSASRDSLRTANKRMVFIKRLLSGQPVGAEEVPKRTLRRWRRAYDDAEEAIGCGYIGLIPRHAAKGNFSARLSGFVEEAIDLSLDQDFLTKKNVSLHYAYACYKADSGSDAVSYETYARRALDRGLVERTERREGKKAAYQRKGPMPSSSIPVDGDRTWEVAHADHTQSSFFLRSGVTDEVLGKPWESLLVDAKGGNALARHVSFLPPSRVSVMMLLRDCVRRHHRLPQRIVVDQGPEFQSIYMESTLAAFWVTKVDRPTAEPRFGSKGERLFRTVETQLLNGLSGNAQALKNPRQMSKSHDPRELALWTPSRYLSRSEEYLFEVHPELGTTGSLESPGQTHRRFSKQAGRRPGRYIAYDDRFLIMTLVEPRNPKRQIHSYGVSINGLRYWSFELEDHIGNKKRYRVRYDPLNLSRAYIHINKRWVQLRCTSTVVRDYFESDLDHAFLELVARMRNARREYREIPAAYVDFVRRCRRDEELMREHRDHSGLANGHESCDWSVDDVSAVVDIIDLDTADMVWETS